MAEPDMIAVDDLVVGDDWGDVLTLDRIDDLSVRVVGNPVLIRFSPGLGDNRYRWKQPSQIFAGVWNNFTDGVLSGFSHFQMRNASAGSPGTVTVRAFCRGGN